MPNYVKNEITFTGEKETVNLTEEDCNITNFSDAPQEIKEKIIRNDELLKAREHRRGDRL